MTDGTGADAPGGVADAAPDRALGHEFDRDLAVVGAGHIGLPWAAVLAAEAGVSVTCVDVDEERVDQVNAGVSPFSEPELGDRMDSALAVGRLRATTDPSVVTDHKYVAITLNAPRRRMRGFVNTVESYLERLTDGQVVVLRSTVPVDIVTTVMEAVVDAPADLSFAVLPERLAEGKAVAEIESLPKVVGADESAAAAVELLLDPLACEYRHTDPETAMFVKLIDNAYRDAMFAISNQIAYVADELGLDAHEAIATANYEYDRNDIPTPGTVGGKCLPKDPHFLMDEFIADQPTTPDLFNFARRTNESLQSYVTTELLIKQPEKVALLGLSYKRGVGDTFNSPAKAIHDALVTQGRGIAVDAYDPHVEGFDGDVAAVLDGADVVVLAVNHAEFDDIEETINGAVARDATVYDVWGHLDRTALDVAYDGLGIN